jgi:ABC-type branched-subunit amino acid transport system ATPase component
VSVPKLLRCTNLVIGYGQTPIIGPLTFEMSLGDAIAVLSPSGSGKSTLLRALVGRARVLSGNLELLGSADPTLIWRYLWRCKIGALLERRPTLVNMTVSEIWTLSGVTDHMGRIRNASVKNFLDKTHLLDRKDVYAGNLSGGERTALGLTVALARASGGGLLLMDNVSGGLYPKAADAAFELLQDAVTQASVGVIFCEEVSNRRNKLCNRSLSLIRSSDRTK